MALFKKDTDAKKAPAKKTAAKKTTKKAVKKTKTERVPAKTTATRSLAHVLIAPRVTEKSAIATEQNVYVFDIDPKATKVEVKGAIEQVYNVVPLKVTTTKVPSRKVFYRGKRGVKQGGKKAYVYLNKSDKIELI